jgi:hypothetical protein
MLEIAGLRVSATLAQLVEQLIRNRQVKVFAGLNQEVGNLLTRSFRPEQAM